jgi:nucleotide-binding universal stress UspA family protein
MATGSDGEQHGRILRRISTPMAGEASDGEPQILVGHDAHAASRAAVRFTADLAVRLGAYLHVVHVVDLADTPIDADSAEWDGKARAALEALHTDARSLLEGFDIGWSYHACHGDPAELLARVAEEHGVLFVAVGATGRNLTRRLMEGGSVSRRLLRRHTLPVLVVPEPPAEAPGEG